MHRLTEDDICCQLRRIQAHAEKGDKDEASLGLGILTTLPRDQWAKAREKLKSGRFLLDLTLSNL